MSHMAAAYVADYTSKKHDGTKACGGFSGAAMNSVDQNRSTIFDVEPAVKKMSTGQLPKSRVAEDEKLSNPYRQQYVPPPRPVSTVWYKLIVLIGPTWSCSQLSWEDLCGRLLLYPTRSSLC